jgi:hypothetical protein|tara:strand:- start:390 stop:2720 length:2331 start_codon:yes stop_codon:yes gene_type:complete
MIKNEIKANYPNHNIDPSQKGKDWCLSYAKASWSDYSSHGTQSFNNNRGTYPKIKDYAQGNQSVNKYKQLMNVDEADNESWIAIDWSVLPIVPKFRRIALGKLSKTEYNITATPIDAMAQSDVEKYYKTKKATMDLRNAAAQSMPGMEEFSALKGKPGDPTNDEELEMHMSFTYKHNAAIEMEQGIDLIFHTNDMEEKRKQINEYLFDFGVAGYKEYIDSNGAVKVRVINPAKILISHSNKRDFSDKIHVGEVTEMSIADLKQRAGNQFDEKDYQDISERFSGRKGSQRMNTSNNAFSKNYDDSKILVLEMEFFSVDQMVHESRTDKRGNKRFGRAGYNSQNKRKNKYVRSSYKTVYKISWIVDSEYCYDYGLCSDMKRVKSNLMDTDLSYHIFAPDFHNMKPLGIMEQLIPIADQIQISWYRLQNTINQARPKGIMIELGALEDIPLGAGGQQMKPMDVIDLFNKTGTLVYRKNDIGGKATNYKPIEELENGLGRDAMTYYQVIQNNIEMIRQITGLNEFTDGSTPDARSLTTTAKLAAQATNNALAHIEQGERRLLERLASAVIVRLQDSVKKNPIEGYVRALGRNTMEFFKLSPSVSKHEFGVKIEDRPTEEVKARLMGILQNSVAQGQVDFEDAVYIEQITNLKQAQQVLSYRIKKKKEEAQANAQKQQEMNGQIQQQSAQAAEQSKQQTLQMEMEGKMQMEKLKAQLQSQLQKEKYEFEMELAGMREEGSAERNLMDNLPTKEAFAMGAQEEQQAMGQQQPGAMPQQQPQQ